jgi:uncharacterized protein YjbJ (UPF0337 family)
VGQLKGRVKEQWGKLTDDEIDQLDGRKDQLSARCRSATASRAIKRPATSITG